LESTEKEYNVKNLNEDKIKSSKKDEEDSEKNE